MEQLAQKAQSLGDLGLAILLSLVASQHCIINAEPDAVDDVSEELGFIVQRKFGLSSKTLHCSDDLTLDEFGECILTDREAAYDEDRRDSHKDSRDSSYFSPRVSNIKFGRQGSRSTDVLKALPHVVILKNANHTSTQVQIQALELLRTRRIYSHTAVYTAPKRFLILFVLSRSEIGPVLNLHLVRPNVSFQDRFNANEKKNDYIYISHFHSAEDGYEYLDGTDWASQDSDSSSSVLKRSPAPKSKPSSKALISSEEIDEHSRRAQETSMIVDVRKYMQNIIAFLRMHRAVHKGVSPRATRYLEVLVKCLAPLHLQSYATPSLVALAVRKIYSHRLLITTPANERSMQWGSDLTAVEAYLENTTPDSVIEDVLNAVDVPV